MSLDREYSDDGKTLTIFVEEKFDYTKVQEFRLAYTAEPTDFTCIVINLQKTEYMDSSALGMLLNMHKTLSDKVSQFKIEQCRPQVLKILQIARFDKKFQIA